MTEFLRFAKPLEICYETVPMRTLVERVAEELHETAPQCDVAFEGTFLDLPGDEALLRQALVNLTRNAAEAGRESGRPPRVTISGTVEELGGRKWQRICVADNGPGIPERDLPKIFLPFYTTKSEGTGLGLAVVQKVYLDFFCEGAELDVELDGSQHSCPDQRRHDGKREKYLQSRGIKTLRFWNSHLRQNAQCIRDTFFNELRARAPHPLPQYTRPVKSFGKC